MKIGCGFWLQWVLVTLVGFLVSLYWVEVGESPDVKTLAGVIGGAAIGLAQWFVMRQQFSQASWWILASVVSWGLFGSSGLGAIGWVAPKVMYIPLRVVYGFVDGAVVGTGTGVAQWLVLRKQLDRAWQWILVNTVSWAVGLASGWTLGGELRKVTGLFLGEVVGLALAWIVVATITGIALRHLAGGTATQKLSN